MDYCRLYASMRDDPKMLGLPDRTFRHHIETMCWVTEHETDGHVPRGLIPERDAARLVLKELWEKLEDGYLIHNWTGRQRTKAQMDAIRNAARKASGTRWRNAKRNPERNAEVEVEREEESEQATASLREAPKAKTADQTLAELLLDASSRAVYMLRRMQERDKRWEKVTTGAVMKLGRTYGAATVIEALSYVYEDEAQPLAPYPYLESVCVRITAERATAKGA